jgi:hypothetical protein
MNNTTPNALPTLLPGTDRDKPMNAVRTTAGHRLVNADLNIYQLMAQLQGAGVSLVLGRGEG